MKRNYSPKALQREMSRVRQQYRSNSSRRDRFLRKLETHDHYDGLRQRAVPAQTDAPAGLLTGSLDAPALLEQALAEVYRITDVVRSLDNGDFTNLRFYINTPYFNRTNNPTAGDPFPMFPWMAPEVSAICALVQQVLDAHYPEPVVQPRLNLVVRQYRPGDVLGFHADRPAFAEDVFGLILQNTHPERGLMLEGPRKKDTPVMLPEEAGFYWRLRGDARWKWKHGFAGPLHRNDETTRTSVTFRFFLHERSIPVYNTDNDLHFEGLL